MHASNGYTLSDAVLLLCIPAQASSCIVSDQALCRTREREGTLLKHQAQQSREVGRAAEREGGRKGEEGEEGRVRVNCM